MNKHFKNKFELSSGEILNKKSLKQIQGGLSVACSATCSNGGIVTCSGESSCSGTDGVGCQSDTMSLSCSGSGNMK